MTEETRQPDVKAIEDDDEDVMDETLAERLWGLTEMFPEGIRNACSVTGQFTWNSTKVTLSFGRNALWMMSSAFTILFLPVLFERERAAMEEQQLQQQRQILMGPNAAVSGQQSGMMGMMPPGAPQ